MLCTCGVLGQHCIVDYSGTPVLPAEHNQSEQQQ